MTDQADIGEYGLHTNWENCEGGLCCDEALAIMKALVAERDEARKRTLKGVASAIRRAEAAEAARDRWRAVACNVKDGTQAAETEVEVWKRLYEASAKDRTRLREALTFYRDADAVELACDEGNKARAALGEDA